MLQVKWGNKGTTEEGAKLRRAEVNTPVFMMTNFGFAHEIMTSYYEKGQFQMFNFQ